MINKLFSEDEIPKERSLYICITTICIDSVLRVDKKNKNETISSDFKVGILKIVDINIASLQCSWIKSLYDISFQEWKLITLKVIKILIWW